MDLPSAVNASASTLPDIHSGLLLAISKSSQFGDRDDLSHSLTEFSLFDLILIQVYNCLWYIIHIQYMFSK